MKDPVDRAPSRFRAVRYSLIAFVLATSLGLSSSALIVTYSDYGEGEPIAWAQAIPLGLADWYTWALVAPGLLWLGGRFPFVRGRRLRSALAVLPACALATLVKIFVEAIASQALTSTVVNPFAGGKLQYNALVAVGIVGIRFAIDTARRSRDGEIARSRLEARLAEARVETLQSRLQPHFLFNTMHSISTLMHRDLEGADRMLARLSELLRMTLAIEKPEVRLREEIDLLETYLGIERVRLGDRLRVDVDVPAELWDLRVPPLLLQPLAENAVRHGIARQRDGGRLEIGARPLDGDRLELWVRDDGAGPPDGGACVVPGVGLSNTRERLVELYGEAGSLRIEPPEGGGFAVFVRVPRRPMREEGAA